MPEPNANIYQMMKKIQFRIADLNDEMNAEKCKFMCIKCNKHHLMQIFLANHPIEKVNILKVFNFKRGGAHPKSLLNVHNA